MKTPSFLSSWRGPLARIFPLHWTARQTALVLALWCAGPLNQVLWQKLRQLPDFEDPGGLKRLFIGVLIAASIFLWLMVGSWPKLRRLWWSAQLLLAASVQHFMLSYGTLMDKSMVANTLHTNSTEAWALVTSALLWHVLLWAGPPLLLLWGGIRLRPAAPGQWRRSLLWVLLGWVVLLGGSVSFYRELAPLIRNHPDIRFVINPLATVTGFLQVTLKPIFKPKKPFQPVTAGAALGPSYGPTAAQGKPPLLVLVVGETARGDHFSFNGYGRNTNPYLAGKSVLSWQQVQSCGTNTMVSVPCMFSPVGKAGYDKRKVEYGNLLDILQAAGLAVSWLDNQAGCKGVCDRIPTAEAIKIASPDLRQQWCKAGECLDRLMVRQLDGQLAAMSQVPGQRGVVLVLHQMGSHGPAYYRRSATDTKHFLPECATHTTAECSRDELVNVYDNSLVETDLFLAETIDWLQQQEAQYDTAMLYVGDHGESLGEHGLYLHGLPYRMAPAEQKHVPWVLWPGRLTPRSGWQAACSQAQLSQELTHDAYFHTVLGLLDVQTPYYKAELDALAGCRS